MPNDRLEEILEDIDETPELVLFFKRLFSKEAYLRLFFVHRDIIFPTSGTVRFPILFWNNIGDEAESALRPISSTVELDDIKREKASDLIGKIIATVGDEIKDLIAYGVIKFVRNNEDIRKLVDSGEFSFKLMKETLRDYSSLNLRVFDGSALQASNTNVDYDPQLDEKFKKLTGAITKGLKGVSEEFVEFLSNLAADPTTFYHIGGYSQLSKLLQVSGLDKNEYGELLTELHADAIVSTFQTIFWCNKCLDNRIVIKTKSELNPSHLSIPCPRCSRTMMTSALYSLDTVVKDAILSKNGLLGVALARLLMENHFDYEAEIFNHQEYDFIAKTSEGTILIECKMHRNDNVNERNVRTWLGQDVKQLSDHFSEARRKRGQSRPFWFTTLRW
ncbi:MAG: hypothetical protein V3U49_06385 [Nitrososphaerales archaeon]